MLKCAIVGGPSIRVEYYRYRANAPIPFGRVISAEYQVLNILLVASTLQFTP